MIKLQKLTEEAKRKFIKLCEEGITTFDITEFETQKISDVEIDEHKRFGNKFALGEYLYEKLEDVQIDTALWHFLTIIYHKQLLNRDGGIGGVDRFCIRKSFYPFTHLLKPVFDLYNFHSSDAELIKFLLLSPVNEGSRLFLETVQRQDIMKNRNFIKVSSELFYDKKGKVVKRGNAEGITRLIDLFKQYERTYDLYSMPSEMILNRLISKHKEFNRFR